MQQPHNSEAAPDSTMAPPVAAAPPIVWVTDTVFASNGTQHMAFLLEEVGVNARIKWVMTDKEEWIDTSIFPISKEQLDGKRRRRGQPAPNYAKTKILQGPDLQQYATRKDKKKKEETRKEKTSNNNKTKKETTKKAVAKGSLRTGAHLKGSPPDEGSWEAKESEDEDSWVPKDEEEEPMSDADSHLSDDSWPAVPRKRSPARKRPSKGGAAPRSTRKRKQRINYNEDDLFAETPESDEEKKRPKKRTKMRITYASDSASPSSPARESKPTASSREGNEVVKKLSKPSRNKVVDGDEQDNSIMDAGFRIPKKGKAQLKMGGNDPPDDMDAGFKIPKKSKAQLSRKRSKESRRLEKKTLKSGADNKSTEPTGTKQFSAVEEVGLGAHSPRAAIDSNRTTNVTTAVKPPTDKSSATSAPTNVPGIVAKASESSPSENAIDLAAVHLNAAAAVAAAEDSEDSDSDDEELFAIAPRQRPRQPIMIEALPQEEPTGVHWSDQKEDTPMSRSADDHDFYEKPSEEDPAGTSEPAGIVMTSKNDEKPTSNYGEEAMEGPPKQEEPVGSSEPTGTVMTDLNDEPSRNAPGDNNDTMSEPAGIVISDDKDGPKSNTPGENNVVNSEPAGIVISNDNDGPKSNTPGANNVVNSEPAGIIVSDEKDKPTGNTLSDKNATPNQNMEPKSKASGGRDYVGGKSPEATSDAPGDHDVMLNVEKASNAPGNQDDLPDKKGELKSDAPGDDVTSDKNEEPTRNTPEFLSGESTEPTSKGDADAISDKHEQPAKNTSVDNDVSNSKEETEAQATSGRAASKQFLHRTLSKKLGKNILRRRNANFCPAKNMDDLFQHPPDGKHNLQPSIPAGTLIDGPSLLLRPPSTAATTTVGKEREPNTTATSGSSDKPEVALPVATVAPTTTGTKTEAESGPTAAATRPVAAASATSNATVSLKTPGPTSSDQGKATSKAQKTDAASWNAKYGEKVAKLISSTHLNARPTLQVRDSGKSHIITSLPNSNKEESSADLLNQPPPKKRRLDSHGSVAEAPNPSPAPASKDGRTTEKFNAPQKADKNSVSVLPLSKKGKAAQPAKPGQALPKTSKASKPPSNDKAPPLSKKRKAEDEMPPLVCGNMNAGVTTDFSFSTKVHLSLDARNPPSIQDRLMKARAESKSRPPKKNVSATAPRGNVLDPPETTINAGGIYADRMYGVNAAPAPIPSTTNPHHLYYQAMQDAMRRQSESAAYYYGAGYPYASAHYGAVPAPPPYPPPILATSRARPAPAPPGPIPSFGRSMAPAPGLPVSRTTAAKPPGPAHPPFTLPAQPNASGRPRAPDPPGEKPSIAYRQDYQYR